MSYRSEFESYISVVKYTDVVENSDLEEIESVVSSILNDVEKDVNEILEYLCMGNFDDARVKAEGLSNNLF